MIEINRDGIIIMGDRPRWEKRVTMREVPFYKCPRCKVEQPHRSKFCPNCGLQLRGFKEEQTKDEF